MHAPGTRRPAPPLLTTAAELQDTTVGYDYLPLRAALWLLALLACRALFFATRHPAPLEAGKVPGFNAPFYPLDLLVPIAAFGQNSAYAPHRIRQWLAYTLTAAGWILTTTNATGITRAVERRVDGPACGLAPGLRCRSAHEGLSALRRGQPPVCEA